jgi:hypothetical protein
MRLRTAAFLVVLVALLCVPVVARADDGPVTDAPGNPGTVEPMNVAGVRMESEAVQIVVYDTFAECHADFRLVNSGPPRTMRVGFPSVSDPKTVLGSEAPEDLGDFRAWQNGRELFVKGIPGHDGRLTARFYEHTIALPTGATTVTVDYLFRTDHEYSSVDPPTQPAAPLRWLGMGGLYNEVDYILHTGALWSGTIGTAVVRVTFDDSCARFGEDALATEPIVTTPGWTKPDPRTFQWVFRDFDPKQDRRSGRSPYDIRLGYAKPTWEPTDAEDQADAYEGDDPEDFVPFAMWRAWWAPPLISDTAAADSRLDFADGEPVSFNEYTPFDGWLDAGSASAWGVRGNTYADTWFKATLSRPTHIGEIRIIPGIDTNRFRDFSRPEVLVVKYSDGSTQFLDVADDRSMQRFAVDKVTDSVRVDVAMDYAGTADLGLTAVTLADLGPSPSPRFLSFADALRLAGPPLLR